MPKFELLWRLESWNTFLIILLSTESKVDCQNDFYKPVVTKIFPPQIIISLQFPTNHFVHVFESLFYVA